MNAMTNAPVGIVYYNTDRGIFVAYTGSIWVEIKNSGQLWTILMNEDFESGSIPSSMNVVDDTNNAFKVGTAEYYQGSYGLYVSNDDGASANYSSRNVCHVYFDVIIPNNATVLSLNFSWKGIAEPSYDYGGVYFDETASYVPSAGSLPSSSSTLYQIGKTEYNDQSTWTKDVINITKFPAGERVRFIMSFRSDSSTENAPSFCLDNIKVEILN
jgi:hypothetical protein